MVRSRFARLPTGQQQLIRQAAVDEFAARGFHDASLNRIIEAAGISKGSMYYHFDGKEDLYAYVARAELEQLFARVGPAPALQQADPEVFWAALTDYYLRLMTALTDAPQLAALLRGGFTASTSAVQRAQQELERLVLPWIYRTLAAGQRVRAVRSDVPSTLLIAVILGMGQAMDVWLMTQQPTPDDLPRLTDTLIGMIRGAIQPTLPSVRTPPAHESAAGQASIPGLTPSDPSDGTLDSVGHA
jgi:AcrR family transcriptional regulator